MIKGYKKNQIVVVMSSIMGNETGTITKIVLNPKKFPVHLDTINGITDTTNVSISVLCENNVRYWPSIHIRRYKGIQVWEEMYIRPATTHEKIARRKGIYLPKKRKSFDELYFGDTIMLIHKGNLIEVKVEAMHSTYIDGKKVIKDVAVFPVKPLEKFKCESGVIFNFVTKEDLLMSSAPPLK